MSEVERLVMDIDWYDWVEIQRLHNDEEFGDSVDKLCEESKGHPWVGRLLDWRYNEDDWGKIMIWLSWEIEVNDLIDRVGELQNRIDELEGKSISDLSDDSLNMMSV